jgi:hypothetical protein
MGFGVQHVPLSIYRGNHRGVTNDVTQRELAMAFNRMIGAGEQTECLSLERMLGITADTVGDVDGTGATF